MSMQTAADVPLLISSANSSSERRISPSWTIAQFKTRLEPITGIPASSQKLILRIGSRDVAALEAADEECAQMSSFPLQAYAEIYVSICYVHSRITIFLLQMRQRMTACHMGRFWLWKDSACQLSLRIRLFCFASFNARVQSATGLRCPDLHPTTAPTSAPLTLRC